MGRLAVWQCWQMPEGPDNLLLGCAGRNWPKNIYIKSIYIYIHWTWPLSLIFFKWFFPQFLPISLYWAFSWPNSHSSQTCIINESEADLDSWKGGAEKVREIKKGLEADVANYVKWTVLFAKSPCSAGPSAVSVRIDRSSTVVQSR